MNKLKNVKGRNMKLSVVFFYSSDLMKISESLTFIFVIILIRNRNEKSENHK